MKRKKDDFEDDGRVIANMNVDGMPWHDRSAAFSDGADSDRNREELQKLTKKQTFFMILGVLGAALAVAAVFAVGYLLFILFCQHVWFK